MILPLVGEVEKGMLLEAGPMGAQGAPVFDTRKQAESRVVIVLCQLPEVRVTEGTLHYRSGGLYSRIHINIGDAVLG